MSLCYVTTVPNSVPTMTGVEVYNKRLARDIRFEFCSYKVQHRIAMSVLLVSFSKRTIRTRPQR